ncbi:MAG: DUF58 domain-containing protein [Pirellulales bacterium]|nr:DUF58 domain-containing protein [Pirellulales bacterium]
MPSLPLLFAAWPWENFNPVMWLLASLLPLLGLAAIYRVYPRWPQLGFALLAACVTLILIIYPGGLWLVLLLDGALVLAAMIDLFSLPRRSHFAVQRETQKIASLRKPQHIRLEVQNYSRRGYLVEIRDDLPPGAIAEPAEFRAVLFAQTRSLMEYSLTANQRGELTLTKVYLRVRSRWGLWHRDLEYPLHTLLHVYPDMKQLEEYAILARTNRLSLLGVRRTRKIGQDNEFERLRDFTRDDSYKHLDWRSTARRRKLTVRDFQANQSQRIVFMIDCGRMMTNEAAGLSLLDHALNSMLMLSYVALRQGDAVGMLCFSNEIHSYVPPRSGGTQMNRLLHAGFNRFPRLVESRYDEAFLYLSANCRKRSLVILLTNIIDEVNAQQVQRYLGAIAGRHLSLGVLLRDRTLFDAVENTPRGDQELYAAAAAADLLLWRRQVITRLGTLGVRSLDLFPEEVTAPLINTYLDIKARHLL